MNSHWLRQSGIKIVDEDRQASDVIHVHMGDDDVLHVSSLVGRERNRDASRVNSDAVVYEIAGETLIQSRVAVAIEGAG